MIEPREKLEDDALELYGRSRDARRPADELLDEVDPRGVGRTTLVELERVRDVAAAGSG